jgi:hypothetical protein
VSPEDLKRLGLEVTSEPAGQDSSATREEIPGIYEAVPEEKVPLPMRMTLRAQVTHLQGQVQTYENGMRRAEEQNRLLSRLLKQALGELGLESGELDEASPES